MSDLEQVRQSLRGVGFSESVEPKAAGSGAVVLTVPGAFDYAGKPDGRLAEAIGAGTWRADATRLTRLAFDKEGELIPDACSLNAPASVPK